MIEKFNKMDNSKKIPIVIGVVAVLIIIIVLFSIFGNKGSNYDSIKENEKKSFVYTKSSSENKPFYTEIPYVNIKDIGINEDIDSFYSDFIDNERVILSYDYNINGKVLSLVLKAVDYDNNDDVPKIYFKSYNINLQDKLLLSDDDVLGLYEVSIDDVNTKIEKKFKKWYKDIVKNGYIDEDECDYECFLEYREVENYMDDVVYSIEKGKLIAYKSFNVYSVLGEESYFKEKDFKFVISK